MNREERPLESPDPVRIPILRAFLRVPLFYKILLANAVIVVLGAVAGTILSQLLLAPGSDEVSPPLFVIILALAGVAVTVLVNAWILRLALIPLRLLESTAAEVRAGNFDARVPHSAVTDRQLERLTGTFNSMLNNLESYSQRLRDVAARALNAEEAERKRIARELHDDTAQTLAALLIRLRVARMATGDTREEELEQFRVQLGEALERIRRFARGLRPPALDEFGLVPALESHVRSLSETVGVPIRVEAQPVTAAISSQAELALYRIAQEALSNAVHHSGASEIQLRIGERDGKVVVEVADNGSGFNREETRDANGRGLGLFGMEERAAYIGGKVEITSRRGAGTTVRASVPANPDRVATPSIQG
jgi:two-component system sensor histidine kinase UhpB